MIQKPRGTSDYIGKEFARRYELENKFVDFYFKKNYQGIETPIFEQKSLFVRSVGDETDIVQKELFDLEKKSDEIYSLRPEFTAGIIRSLIEMGIKSMPLPVKIISYGPCFRYERPQKGRKRQFNQLNVEVIGKKSEELDGDIICDAITFLKSTGINDVTLNINSLGSSESRQKYARIIKDYLVSNKDRLCEVCTGRTEKNPLRVLDCKNQDCRATIEKIPKITDSLSGEEKKYFDNVIEILKKNNVKLNIDPFLVRGLDYYTGVIFEFNAASDESRMSSIGGGGRYDNLVGELGGPDLPAIGLGFGFERIVEILKPTN
ncbi:MAG: histidine--tRNA ligase [Candidatus Berkelbacteria bacterium]|nr:histidine--tRNA ligase [Candidatus Berkelbacteria bacterium]